MNKVVINRCYGGFGLSRQAAERLIELGLKDNGLVEALNQEKFIIDAFYPSVPRHHPLLVQVVEELGEKASGDCAQLEVVQIEEDLYSIEEYDGFERIETPSSHQWTNCKDLATD